MSRYTKAENIKDLIEALNEKRTRRRLPAVSRQWTGAGHWLREPVGSNEYRSMGGIFTNDDRFIGFLEGLLYEAPKRKAG